MGNLAEGEGFEPPVPFRVQRFSRPPVSTTHTSLRTTLLTDVCGISSLAGHLCKLEYHCGAVLADFQGLHPREGQELTTRTPRTSLLPIWPTLV